MRKGTCLLGKADTITRQYMNDSTIFADAFNFWVYNGRQVIQPEQLQPLNTTAVETLFTSDGKNVPIQKIRDTLKYLTVMTDDAAAYAVLGIENQTDIHYVCLSEQCCTMPWNIQDRFKELPQNTNNTENLVQPTGNIYPVSTKTTGYCPLLHWLSISAPMNGMLQSVCTK